MRRITLRLLLGINLLLLPAGCLPALFIANSVNPMQLVFIADFRIENRTDERLLVTPVGTIDPAGTRSRLPLYRSPFPAFPSRQSAKFVIAPGESRKLFYDWDDINFSELVVERDHGERRMLVVNPSPTKQQFTPVDPRSFVITDFAALPQAPPNVSAAYEGALEGFDWTWVFLLFIPWLTFWPLLLTWFRNP